MPEQPTQLMTPEQVAEYLQLSRDTVYRYIRDGKLTAVRLGRSYRVRKEDLDEFLAHHSMAELHAGRFRRLSEIAERNAERNAGIPPEEIERDIAEAIAEARRELYERERRRAGSVVREDSDAFELS